MSDWSDYASDPVADMEAAVESLRAVPKWRRPLVYVSSGNYKRLEGAGCDMSGIVSCEPLTQKPPAAMGGA